MPWPDDMVALPEKGTMFSIEVIGGDSEAPPRFWTADAALPLVPDGRTFPTGVNECLPLALKITVLP